MSVLAWCGLLVVAVLIGRAWMQLSEQPTEPLATRERLRASLELLWSRGVEGTEFVIEFPPAPLSIRVTKRLLGTKRIALVVGIAGGSLETVTRTERSETAAHRPRGNGQDRAEAVREAIDRIERVADAAELRLFPDAVGRFSGRILTFNVAARTGTAD